MPIMFLFCQKKKESSFLLFQCLALIADIQRMGGNRERKRLNVVRCGREEWGVLDMNPGFAGKWGDRMRRCECRHW